VNGFIDAMGKTGLSAARKNIIIRAGTTAFKWAYNREMTDQDLSAGIIYFSGRPKERQILSPEQAAAVFRAPWKDERPRLVNLLAAVTGLRSGVSSLDRKFIILAGPYPNSKIGLQLF
jgi:hypothetical protein